MKHFARRADTASDPVRVGPYVVTGRLGRGGNASVYRATSSATGEVAVKVMRGNSADLLTGLVNEFETGRRVDPRYVAAPIAFGTSDVGPYLAMRLHRHHVPLSAMRRGSLTGADLWRVAGGLARAIDAVHAAGVIHCDVKPSNILVYGDSVRLIDFGIARVASQQPLSTSFVHFSRGWSAPEQLLAHPLTPAVDVFSWGCVIASLAAGANPYAASTDEDWVRRVQVETPSLEAVPSGLRHIVQAALSKEPSDRPSAAQLVDACRLHRRVPVTRSSRRGFAHARATGREVFAA